MSLSLGNAIAVSTNFIKSNPAVPVYKGEENPNNLYAVIYHCYKYRHTKCNKYR